jgi:hypothetical protein
MSGGRHHRVLFDLVTNGKDSESARAKQERALIESKPAATPPPAPAASGTPASAPSDAVGARDVARPRIEVIDPKATRATGRSPHAATATVADATAQDAPTPRDSVVLRTNTLYVLGAVVLGVMVIIWVAAYKFGGSAKEDELKPFLLAGVPQATDPLGKTDGSGEGSTPAPANQKRPAQDPPKPRPQPRPEQPRPEQARPEQAQPKDPGKTSPPSDAVRLTAAGLLAPVVTPAPSATGEGFILTAKGRMAEDPRPGGRNYFVIERLPSDDAEKAIKFLSDNGIECIGVPVDRTSGGANNPLLYQVVSLAGLTREEFRSEAQARAAFEAEIKRLGEVWQKDHKGTSKFSKPQWVRYGS